MDVGTRGLLAVTAARERIPGIRLSDLDVPFSLKTRRIAAMKGKKQNNSQSQN